MIEARPSAPHPAPSPPTARSCFQRKAPTATPISTPSDRTERDGARSPTSARTTRTQRSHPTAGRSRSCTSSKTCLPRSRRSRSTEASSPGSRIAGWIASDPAWSPDGTEIAFVTSGVDSVLLSVLDRSGRLSRSLLDVVTSITSPSWSPDGSWIAFGVVPEAIPRVGWHHPVEHADRTSTRRDRRYRGRSRVVAGRLPDRVPSDRERRATRSGRSHRRGPMSVSWRSRSKASLGRTSRGRRMGRPC